MMTRNGDVTIPIELLADVCAVLKACGAHGDHALQNALKISALGNLQLSPSIREALARDAQAEIPRLRKSVDSLTTVVGLLLERLTAAATPCGPVM